MTKIETVRYTAKTYSTDGSDVASHSADGALDVKVSLPTSSSGATNPEHLFAVGLSVCFIGAIGRAARALEVVLPADIAVEVEADLDTTGYAYLVQACLNISLPGLSRRTAEALVEAAQELCPYARAVRVSVEVGLNLN